jgi:membrane-associated phospholipid phosphatase
MKSILKNIKYIFPEEIYGFLIILFFIAVRLYYGQFNTLLKFNLNNILFIVSFLFILSLFIFLNPYSKAVRIFRAVFPIILLFAIFNNLGSIVKLLNPEKYDWLMIKIDKMLVGCDLSVWMQRFYNPILSNVMFFSYIFYFLLHITLGLLLYFNKKYEGYREFVSTLLICAFTGYIFYIIFPVVGPRFTLANLYEKDFGLNKVFKFLVDLINEMEPLKEDCFPSLHISLSLVTIFFAFKYLRKVFYILLPLVIMLSISTIYCRYHYFIDVIAGMILAILSIYFCEKLNRFWNTKILDRSVHFFYF